MADNSHSREGGNLMPPDWITVKFTDVLDVQGGTQPPKSQFIDEPKEGYIRLLQIRDFGAKPVPTYIPDTSKLKKCEEDDLLIGRYGASLGRICSGMVGAYNVALAKVLSVENLHKPFLKSYLESELFQQPLALLSRSAQNGFNKDDLATFDFALPPLAEQKVIAEKLDTLLAQVDTTKARLERIPDIIKRFRQSVLAAAVSGRLTEEWREVNSGHYSPKLNEKYDIDDKYTYDIPINWTLTAIGNCSSFQQGLQIAKNTRATEPGDGVLPILRTVNYENGFQHDVHYASFDNKTIIAEPEDVVISRTGTVGRVLTGYKGIIHNNSFRLNYEKSLLNREYLIFFLQSPACQLYVQENSGRSTQPDLTHKAFSRCPLSLPPKNEQTEIVRRVEELFAFADTIEQKATAALERVNNLTQSILAKAFRGELTADWRAANPELITGENSAEALLARIQAEREALALEKKAAKKPRKKKA